jgi:flagellar basal-body rod modification protein FlgD
MTLLLAELKYQNPLEPMDTNQMVSQMVQMNSLTQLQTISAAIEKTNESNLFQSGTGLIGKTVGYYDDDGNLQAGVVDAFEMDGDNLILSIGDTIIDLDSIAFVSQTSETEDE